MQENEEQVSTSEETEVDFEALAAEFGGSEEQQEQPTEEVAEEAAPVPDQSEPQEVTPEPAQELKSPYLVQIAELEAKHREELAAREQGFSEKAEETKAALVAEIKRNPLAFFEQHGFTAEDAEDLALHAYRHKLGDEAPEELLKRTAKSELDRRFIEQEKKFKELENKMLQQQQQLQARTILSNIEDFAKKVPDSMPYLAAETPDDVINDIATLYSEIIKTGRQPSISECAQMLEAQHAKLAQKYTKQRPATPAPQTKANEPEETVTIDSESLNDRSTKKPAADLSSDDDILAEIQKQIAKGGFGSLS